MIAAPSLAAVVLLRAVPWGHPAPTVTVDWLPAEDTPVLGVFELPGFGPDYAFGGLPQHAYARLQLQARGAPRDYITPQRIIYRAWRELGAVAGVSVTAASIVAAFPAYSPADLPTAITLLAVEATDLPELVERDERDRCVFTANFTVSTAVPSPCP